MRTIVAVLLLLALPAVLGSSHQSALVSAQSDQPKWYGHYFRSPDKASRVSITRNGTLLVSLDVPEDVHLSVYWEEARTPTIEFDRATFPQGNVEIRTLLASERNPGGPRESAKVMMEQAPLVMAIEDVQVVVESYP